MTENIEISGQKAEGNATPEAAMKKGHVLDLKLPIGWLLSAYGVLLFVWGLATRHNEMYAKSLGFNVNLVWGIIMIVIGGAFLLTAFLKRGRASAK